MKIQILQIKVNEGRREASPEAIQELADSISKIGLLNPITVDKDYTLIAGLHRLEAAKLLGWTEIECSVSDLDGLAAELAEIDENFVRKNLSDIERGELLLRRKEIYEALHPETCHGMRNGQTSKDCKLQSLGAKAFIQETADQLGVDKSTIARQIQTAKNLTPEAKDIIRGADVKITKANTLKLSRLAPEQQKEAATQLVTGAIRSVDEYHPASEKSESTPTIQDFAADLKNPDKDRRPTSSSFLMTFSCSLHRFCQSVKSYAVNEYVPVFPTLTQEQLDQVRQEINSVRDALEDLYETIEGKAKNEQTITAD